MNNPKIAILGSGIAGISAGYYLKKIGQQSVIFEKDNDWGGLCGQFSINGFRFDRFVHFTFTNNREVADIFQHSSQLIAHSSISYNYFEGKWLKHPVQNNLSPLPTEMKVKIIDDFVNRPKTQFENISNYAQWLDSQYGFYFAKTFPYAYTRKYWGVNPD
ncbi:MAG: hypothetical protein EOM76_11090, partial [Sphingobacteriia bacterium]|nr:hypothetical protein [Sphingobacteriia bacterium]